MLLLWAFGKAHSLIKQEKNPIQIKYTHLTHLLIINKNVVYTADNEPIYDGILYLILYSLLVTLACVRIQYEEMLT